MEVIKDIWNSDSWLSLIRGLVLFICGLLLIVFKDDLISVNEHYYSIILNFYIIVMGFLFYLSDVLVALYELITRDYKQAVYNIIQRNNEVIKKIQENDDVPQYLKNQLDDHIIEESSIL